MVIRPLDHRISRPSDHTALVDALERADLPADGPDGETFHAVIDPIAAKHDVTPQQIALAWQLRRTATALPIPGTTSIEHSHENLSAANIGLTKDEIDAITALASED